MGGMSHIGAGTSKTMRWIYGGRAVIASLCERESERERERERERDWKHAALQSGRHHTVVWPRHAVGTGGDRRHALLRRSACDKASAAAHELN